MFRRSTALAAFALLGALTLAGCSSPTTVTSPTDEDTAGAVSDKASEEPAVEQGTRENPFPLGTAVSSDDWTVVINSVTLGDDAAAQIADANIVNTPADEGHEYVVINYTVTYTGDDADGQSAMLVGVEYVTGSGTTVSRTDKMVVAPDPANFTLATLYNGGSVTGNDAVQVPSPVDGVLAVRPGLVADKSFVAVQ